MVSYKLLNRFGRSGINGNGGDWDWVYEDPERGAELTATAGIGWEASRASRTGKLILQTPHWPLRC